MCCVSAHSRHFAVHVADIWVHCLRLIVQILCCKWFLALVANHVCVSSLVLCCVQAATAHAARMRAPPSGCVCIIQWLRALVCMLLRFVGRFVTVLLINTKLQHFRLFRLHACCVGVSCGDSSVWRVSGGEWLQLRL